MEISVQPSFPQDAPPITEWLIDEVRRFITRKVGYDVSVEILLSSQIASGVSPDVQSLRGSEGMA